MDNNDLIYKDKKPIDILTDYGKGHEPKIDPRTDYGKGLVSDIDSRTDYGKGLVSDIDSRTDFGKGASFKSVDGREWATMEQVEAVNTAFYESSINKSQNNNEEETRHHR